MRGGFRPARARIRAIAALAGLIGTWLAAVPGVSGHAIILESSPQHEETLPAPRRLVLRFNSRIEKRLCSVRLVGPREKTVLLLRQEPEAPPDTLIYALPALDAGSYHARWKVLAADGHVTEGVIAFTVAGGDADGTRRRP